jgi:hypothetical protein
MRTRVKYLLFLAAPVVLAAPFAVPLPNAPPLFDDGPPPILGSSTGFFPGTCERGPNGEITGPEGCVGSGPAAGSLPFQPVSGFGEDEAFAFESGVPGEEDEENSGDPAEEDGVDQDLIENAFWENTEDGAFGLVGPLSFTAGGAGGSLYFTYGGTGPQSGPPPGNGSFGNGSFGGTNGSGNRPTFLGAFAPGGIEPGGENAPADGEKLLAEGGTGGNEGGSDQGKNGAPGMPPGDPARDGETEGSDDDDGPNGGAPPKRVEIPGLPPGGSQGGDPIVTTANGGGSGSGGQNGTQGNGSQGNGGQGNGGQGGPNGGGEPFEVAEPHALLVIAGALAVFGMLRRRRLRA